MKGLVWNASYFGKLNRMRLLNTSGGSFVICFNIIFHLLYVKYLNRLMMSPLYVVCKEQCFEHNYNYNLETWIICNSLLIKNVLQVLTLLCFIHVWVQSTLLHLSIINPLSGQTVSLITESMRKTEKIWMSSQFCLMKIYNVSWE